MGELTLLALPGAVLGAAGGILLEGEIQTGALFHAAGMTGIFLLGAALAALRVTGVSCEFRQGQVYAIVGSSGSDKTTVLFLLADKPTGNLDSANSQNIVEILQGLPMRKTAASSSSPTIPPWQRRQTACCICATEASRSESPCRERTGAQSIKLS